MIHITFIASYKQMSNIAEDIYSDIDPFFGPELHDLTNKLSFETVLANAVEVQNMQFNADVLIARGSIAASLKQRKNYIPVIELYVGGKDLLRSFLDAQKLVHNARIALVSCPNTILEAQGLAQTLDMRIHCFEVLEPHLFPDALVKARKAGCNVVVAGPVGCRMAQANGMKSVVIESGKESIRKAIIEAKRMAYIIWKEKERAELFKTILDTAQEGVLVFDKENRLTETNIAVKELLHLPEEIENDNLSKRLYTLFHIDRYDGTSKTDLLVLGSQRISYTISPISLQDTSIGYIVIFQNVNRIQKLEETIRTKLYSRGHIAKYTFDSIIGTSRSLTRVVSYAKRISPLESNILLHGETGTGKELFAQSIHNHSPRFRGPFIAFNCAALPEDLLESELFGYVEGAFTGARRGGKPGLFELAHRGTIFLDEIGEIPKSIQSRLLRVIQEKEIMRLGDSKVIPIDVRIISATNRNLSEEVQKGTFRQDLFFRIDVLSLTLPPLSERTDDIPILVTHFMQQLCMRLNRRDFQVEPDVLEYLQKLTYRGNIRELENICERLMSLCEGPVLTLAECILILKEFSEPQEMFRDNRTLLNIHQTVHNLPIDAFGVVQALKTCRYNKVKAAELLGISRSTLYRLIKQYGLR